MGSLLLTVTLLNKNGGSTIFPILAPNTLLIHVEEEHDEFFVIPPGGDDWRTLSPSGFNMLWNANGLHSIKDSIFYRLMVKEGVLTTKRYVRQKGIFNYLILLPFPGRVSPVLLRICGIINQCMPVVAAVLLLMGHMLRFIFQDDYFWIDFSVILYILMILIGFLIHEMGHLIAAIAYGQNPRHLGVLLLFGFIPVGLYVYCGDDSFLSARERVPFFLSGLLAQSIYTGVLLLLSIFCSDVAFASAAFATELIMLFNLLPLWERLDGEQALSALLGVDSISVISDAIIRKSEARQALSLLGAMKKKAILCCCFLVYISRIAYFVYLYYAFFIWI